MASVNSMEPLLENDPVVAVLSKWLPALRVNVPVLLRLAPSSRSSVPVVHDVAPERLTVEAIRSPGNAAIVASPDTLTVRSRRSPRLRLGPHA